MILFFSGTGNSKHAAQMIADILQEETVSINDIIKSGKKQPLISETPFIFVTPTYAWRIPKIVENFIENTDFQGSDRAYFILTCGDSVGNAHKYIQKLCEKKNFKLYGMRAVTMPENYIAMFDVPSPGEAAEIIKNADNILTETAQMIKEGESLPATKSGFMGKILSGPINGLFYKTTVKADGFRSTEKCSRCGLCEKLCPLNNIRLEQEGPKWGNNCTHCMACICRCPSAAIEYKNVSVNKRRYVFPEK